MPKKPKKTEWAIGKRFAKPDIERLGIFVEMPYPTGKWTFPPLNVHKGATFLTEYNKTKNGTQTGYFDKEFRRLFVGEAIKGRGRKPKPGFPNISQKPFMPTDGSKLHSTPGDYYGTFTKHPAFSALLKKQKHVVIETAKNFVTSNSKKGGPGYKDICIGPYPPYMPPPKKRKKPPPVYGKILNGPVLLNNYPQRYFDKNPFQDPPKIKPGSPYVRPKDKIIPALPPGYITPIGPNKLKGKELFSLFPRPKKDPYITDRDADKYYEKKFKKPNFAGPFCPQSTADKSMYTKCMMQANAFKVNINNYTTAEPNYIKYLVC